MDEIIITIMVSAGISLIIGSLIIKWVKNYTKLRLDEISNRFMQFLKKVKF